MSEPVKVAGICMSGLGAIAFGALGLMELCYSFAGVFGAGLFQVHIADVCQRTEPGEDVGKLFFSIGLVVGRQSGG